MHRCVAMTDQRGLGRQPYGSMWSVNHPEAYRIWLKRDVELEPTPEFGMVSLSSVDDDDDKAAIHAAEIARLVAALVTPRQMLVLRYIYWQGLTLEETGQIMGVSRERVRQIEQAAIRKIKTMAFRWGVRND
jgi:RNA polymerase sigma factor (sigma-70 family)